MPPKTSSSIESLHAHQFTPPLDPRVLNPSIPDDLGVQKREKGNGDE